MTKIGVSSREADAFAEITQRLRHYRSMVANYQACKELYDQLYPSGTQVLSDMPKAPTVTYEVERWADRRMDLSIKMRQSLNEMAQEISEIMDMMNSLEPGESAVLIRRYIFGEPMEQVAETIHYSVRWCWSTHNRAVEKIIKKGKANG